MRFSFPSWMNADAEAFDARDAPRIRSWSGGRSSTPDDRSEPHDDAVCGEITELARRCFTCDVNSGVERAPGGTIYEDERWIADHGVSRLVRGYVVLKPKRHVHELADLESEEASSLGPVLRTLLAAMRAALQPERIYVCSFAETVHHLHFHLLPRYADIPGLGPDLMPALFREGRYACTEAEAVRAAAAIRSVLTQPS